VEIKEVRRVRGINEKGGEMVLVKLGSEEQKGKVVGEKKILKGRKERISEDLTWRERNARWNLQELARSEERKGRRLWVRQDRIRIDEQWWRWDEEEEVLKDERGNVRGGKQGTQMEEEKGERL